MSAEERLAARREQTRIATQRYRARLHNPTPTNGITFHHYQPVPPQTQVIGTDPSLGLVVNSDISLPRPPVAPTLPPPPPYPFHASVQTQQQQPQQSPFDQFGFASRLTEDEGQRPQEAREQRQVGLI